MCFKMLLYLYPLTIGKFSKAQLNNNKKKTQKTNPKQKPTCCSKVEVLSFFKVGESFQKSKWNTHAVKSLACPNFLSCFAYCGDLDFQCTPLESHCTEEITWDCHPRDSLAMWSWVSVLRLSFLPVKCRVRQGDLWAWGGHSRLSAA